MSEPPAIAITGLRHSYRDHRALAGVSFTVPARTIHGFVGPNGAGKTTTLRVLATLLKPDVGGVRVFDEDLLYRPELLRRRIGFMPDHFSMHRALTVAEYLDFFAAAYGQQPAERTRTIAGVLELTDLAGRRDDPIPGLSRGMQQRVALARVLVHDPDLLLLDEPASGLDPRARLELMEVLRELKRMGKTVFISSHILAELAGLCDAVTILDRGTVRFSGAVDDLLRAQGSAGGPVYLLALAAADAPALTALRAAPGVTAAAEEDGRPERLRVELAPGADPATALAAAVAAGARVLEWREQRREIGEAFLDLTTPGVRER